MCNFALFFSLSLLCSVTLATFHWRWAEGKMCCSEPDQTRLDVCLSHPAAPVSPSPCLFIAQRIQLHSTHALNTFLPLCDFSDLLDQGTPRCVFTVKYFPPSAVQCSGIVSGWWCLWIGWRRERSVAWISFSEEASSTVTTCSLTTHMRSVAFWSLVLKGWLFLGLYTNYPHVPVSFGTLN